MTRISDILQFAGTFLPILGMATALGLAAVPSLARRRWAILILGPLATAALCALFGWWIAYDGNMLFALIMVIFLLLLPAYYVLLLAAWVLLRRRSRSATQAPG